MCVWHSGRCCRSDLDHEEKFSHGNLAPDMLEKPSVTKSSPGNRYRIYSHHHRAGSLPHAPRLAAPPCSPEAPHSSSSPSTGSGSDTSLSSAVVAVVSRRTPSLKSQEAAAQDFLLLSLLSSSEFPPRTGTFLSSATLEVLLLLHNGAASLHQQPTPAKDDFNAVPHATCFLALLLARNWTEPVICP